MLWIHNQYQNLSPLFRTKMWGVRHPLPLRLRIREVYHLPQVIHSRIWEVRTLPILNLSLLIWCEAQAVAVPPEGRFYAYIHNVSQASISSSLYRKYIYERHTRSDSRSPTTTPGDTRSYFPAAILQTNGGAPCPLQASLCSRTSGASRHSSTLTTQENGTCIHSSLIPGLPRSPPRSRESSSWHLITIVAAEVSPSSLPRALSITPVEAGE